MAAGVILEVGAVVMMSVTSYGLGCDAPGPHTKSGVAPLAHWTAAADPVVLPLGSVVHVEGVGVRGVEDIGGGIKGRELDLFMNDCDEARQWGRRNVRVHVLHVPESRSKPSGVETRSAVASNAKGKARVAASSNPRPVDPASASIATPVHRLSDSELRLLAIVSGLLLGAIVLAAGVVWFALLYADCEETGRVLPGRQPRKWPV